MNKQEFLEIIANGISDLSPNDIKKSLEYYSEMIDDRIEDGLSEEDAVSAMGDPNEIIKQILINTPLSILIKPKVKSPHKFKAWEIILLILGLPIWFPLLMSAFVVFISVYIVIWTVIFSLYAADFSFGVGSLLCIVSVFTSLIFMANIPLSICSLGFGLILFGLTILSFFALNKVTKTFIYLNKKLFLWVKSLFVRKESL